MSTLVLMTCNGESMNVPEDKVEAYLENGWKEISRSYQDAEPEPQKAHTAAVSAETAEPERKVKGKA